MEVASEKLCWPGALLMNEFKLGWYHLVYSWVNSTWLNKGDWNNPFSSKGEQLHLQQTCLFLLQCCGFGTKRWLSCIILDSSLLASALLGDYCLQLWEINVFQLPPSTGKHGANAKYSLQIFMLLGKTSMNDLFIIISGPPLCG